MALENRDDFEEWHKANYSGLDYKRASSGVGAYFNPRLELDYQLYAAGQQKGMLKTCAGTPVAPALPPIEVDNADHRNRVYIPLPNGWEVQTKGSGSTFRIARTDGSDERWPVLEKMLHEPLERMARDLHAAFTQSQAPIEGTPYGIIDPDYARVFSIARCAAWAYGYSAVMHGSFTRDLDLLLVPWAETSCKAEHLVKHIAKLTQLEFVDKPPTEKPHGRMAYTLMFSTKGDPRFIDISVMPLGESSNAKALTELHHVLSDYNYLLSDTFAAGIDATDTGLRTWLDMRRVVIWDLLGEE
jgi:hypothetical protein